MHLLVLRFLTRFLALLAIMAGVAAGLASITPGESVYGILLILVGVAIGWRSALWANNEEVRRTGREPEKPPGWPISQEEARARAEAKQARREARKQGGRHRR